MKRNELWVVFAQGALGSFTVGPYCTQHNAELVAQVAGVIASEMVAVYERRFAFSLEDD